MADLLTRPNGGSRRLAVSDLFGFDPFRAFPGSTGNGSGLALEVQKTDDGWTVELPVPGYRPDQIEVTVEDRVLTVTGTSERRSFQRSIFLPEEIDTAAIDAKVEHGLLALGLHLQAKARPRKIDVQVVN
jgi:HSP20 family protein